MNAYGGQTHTHKHTHIHTYSHSGQKQFQNTSYVLAFGWRVPGLKIEYEHHRTLEFYKDGKIGQSFVQLTLII